MSQPCIICVAITGSLPTKENNPAVPITIAEQIESSHEAFEAGAAPLPYAAAANLVFARFYRPPSAYADLLAELGFGGISVQTVEIEMPFHVIAGQKP